jgi:hypothetical protein
MQDATLSTIEGGQDPTGYVDAPKLLETLFPQPECRPSLRWLRDHQGELPHIRIGRLVFFDPPLVKAHLDAKAARRHGAGAYRGI